MINLDMEKVLEIPNRVDDTFKITDLDSCSWTFRKLLYYKEQAKVNNDLAYRELQRIEAWRLKENEETNNSITYFNSLLETYYREQKAIDPKLKPISTPWGKISKRKVADKWEYDELTTLAWCKQNQLDCYIKLNEELKKDDFKKQFKNGIDKLTGEKIPGITITPQDEKIIISVED